MKIIFWANIPSVNMAPLWIETSLIWPYQVEVIAEERMGYGRDKLGWKVPDLEGVRIRFLEDLTINQQDFVAQFVAEHKNDIHILGLGNKSAQLAMKELQKLPNPKIVIIAERIDFRNATLALKAPIYYRRFSRFNGFIAAFLAMGELGVRSFSRLGVSADKLYPFTYALRKEPLLYKSNINNNYDRPINFVYVGRNSKIKGCDILFKAFSCLSGDNWHLSIAGFTATNHLIKNISKSGIVDKVTFLGPIQSDQIFEVMASHDACIVPSRYDGWGMAASEAIASGVGAIVTDKVGSVDIVKYSGAGHIVKAGSVRDLIDALENLMENPQTINSWKIFAQKYASNLSSQRLAKYLIDIICLKFKFTFNSDNPVYPLLNI